MKSLYKFIFLGLLLFSCSQVPTINLKKHDFSYRPSQIVWIQVAGLKAEHLSMLRFGFASSNERLSIERATCVGKMWNYNLYQLRPDAHSSFLSQLTGSKNITKSCQDLSRPSLWSKLGPEEYRVGVLETAPLFSLEEKISKCQEDENLNQDYNDMTFWRMAKSPQGDDSRFFHYQDQKPFELGQTFYDQSCQGERCFSSLFNNVKSIWENFSPDYQRKIFIIQDYSYLESLRDQNITKAREILAEIEKIYSYFSEKEKSKRNFLLILSSAESYGLEMPRQGADWAEFERSGRNILFRDSSLDSMIFSQGASSENLCGVYEDAEVFHRILWKTDEFKIW